MNHLMTMYLEQVVLSRARCLILQTQTLKYSNDVIAVALSAFRYATQVVR